MINKLPEDVLSYMSENFLNKNNQRLINTCQLYPNYDKEDKNNLITKSAYRIMLFYLIKKNQINLFREIDKTLNTYIFWTGGIKKFDNQCLLYAPHIQYGLCRYCNKHLNYHKYYKMMKIYFKLSANN